MAEMGPGGREPERETKAGETQAEEGPILKSIFFLWINFRGL